MDFDSIPYGVDFRDHIRETLKRAKVVVAIIGADWSGGQEAAPRRIDDPGDFVRLEIASALESGIPIIPVLVNNTPMPDAKNLPAELEGLTFRNGLALDTGIDFHHHTDRLIAGIHKVIDPPAPSSAVTTPPKADVTRRKTLLLAATVASLAALAGIAGWYVLKPISDRTQTSPATASTAQDTEAGRESTYFGKVGTSDAIFRLRFEGDDRVTGTYSQGGSTYRIEGRHSKDRLSLDEYTGERITAHIELASANSVNINRWEGIMRNTPPDNRIISVSLGDSPPAASLAPPASPAPSPEISESSGEYTYSGKIGRADASFRLRFEADDRVTGSYSQKRSTYRLDGRHLKGKLLLDEYTGERASAHLELASADSADIIRWEGTMRNTPPDSRAFPVSFSRSKK
jgi:hypothetical protein